MSHKIKQSLTTVSDRALIFYNQVQNKTSETGAKLKDLSHLQLTVWVLQFFCAVQPLTY